MAYSSPSVVLQARNPDGSKTVFDDFREAYYWLAHNTPENAKASEQASWVVTLTVPRARAQIMSWWDYGYQIKGMANRTVIVDNNTRNNTHIGAGLRRGRA